jgi:hypothetical protein
MKDISLDELTLGKFTDALNTKFRVRGNATDVVELELIAAQAGRAHQPSRGQARYESFSLLVAGPSDQPLIQRLYPFEHDQIGRFELFIVPVGCGTGVLHYQAVFNRPVTTA